TSTKGPNGSTSSRAVRRVSSYGEIAAAITAAPWRVNRAATQPTRSMCVSRSSFEKPSPFDRCVRTVSPSRYSTMWPRRSSSGPTRCAIVVLPEPDRPVNQSVKPPPRTRSDSGRVRAGEGLLAADAADPRVVRLKRALQRLDLADVAAAVRIALPQIRSLLRVLLGDRDHVRPDQLEAVPLDEPLTRVVRLPKEQLGVELDDRNVEPE